ncbi:hypothetical protein VTH06DRAFT_5529 [Thermothelomyces fergusii]
MRIRLPFAGVFVLLSLLAGYAGLSSVPLSKHHDDDDDDDGEGWAGVPLNDKALHLLTFFALTVVFYWAVDAGRRRTVHLTLVVCAGGLGVGSEFVQAALPNGRVFDPLDIAANLAGSLAALGLCSWYHKRMLERRRRRKYAAVPSGDAAAADAAGADLELGEGPGIRGAAVAAASGEHEEGVVTSMSGAAAAAAGGGTAGQ